MLSLLAALALPLIPPSDARIVTVGRFDWTNKAAPACQWPASEIRLRVKGPGLKVRFDESGDDLWAVEVDGKQSGVLKLNKGADTYTIEVTSGTHDVSFIKRTESFVGTTRFLGVEGKLEPATRKKRTIEVVGDSITCGYGNEGASQNEHFKPETENAYMSYASIAARSVNADVTLIAWSGRKMWPDNTMPEIYDRVLPTQEQPKYDFKGPVPSAVVINLATNDFGRGNPDEKGWTDAYEAFIRRVWSHYPKAHIYLATGSMMSDNYPQGQNALTTVKGYLDKIMLRMHDKRMHRIDFDMQRMEDGIGSDWHPSIKTDQIMGAKLAAALRKDLGW